MEKIEPQNSRFYLSRKLIVVVTLFILIASVLVVLTNFSINMIAASRDYTALLSKWGQYHYKAGMAIEEYSRTGMSEAYQEYVQIKNMKEQLRQPIDELFKEKADTKLIFESLRSDEIIPNEISTLIFAFNWFNNSEVVQEIRREWQRLHKIETRQRQLFEQLHQDWNTAEPDRERINQSLSVVHKLNGQWANRNDILMDKVEEASISIKRFGLWISVILGILLVLIGIIVSVRASKSIGRWEQSLHEKEILLSEIHHRVKNNLAVISGLLELESMQSRNPEQALKESRDRIHSMAMIHEILYQSQSFAEIRMDHYIKELSEYITDTYVRTDKNIDLHVNLEPVTLNINQAVPAGLVLNELVTNAIEHGFKSIDQGSIVVNLEESQGEIRLSLQDNGNGLPSKFDLDKAETTGFTIIKALVQQLDADFRIRNSNGTIVELVFEKSNASGSNSGYI